MRCPRPRTLEHVLSTSDTHDHPTTDTPEAADAPVELPPTFAELGAVPAIVDALAADGIERAFPIQAMCIPLALEGRDLIGQAKTGTGKTLGFGIPLLQRVVAPSDPAYADLPPARLGKPQALVVVPTRELGIQVASDLEQAGRGLGIRVLTVYGGRAYEPQIEALERGVDVVVGTPGRLIDLSNKRHLDLSQVRTLVLDEADEMLDMGFLPDVDRIVAQTPATRQTLLFSATMPGQIVNLARRFMTQPTHIRAADPGDDNATVDAIEQHVWRAHPMDKVELVARVLQAQGRGLTLIFTRTKRKAQKISDELSDRGFAAAAVHGDLGQGAREQALRAFRNGKVDVLVATDVAARGIDVEGVTHVINYECPDDEKTYLHRIGRTGRAGNAGVAVTFVDWEDVARWQMIDKALRLPFRDPIETYSTSEHVYTGLGIPAGATGTLPKAARTRAGLDAEVLEDLGETGGKGRSSDRGRDRDSGRSRGKGGDRDRGKGGDRGRGGRSHTSRGGDHGGPAAEASTGRGGADDSADAPARPKRTRSRRRTRGGKPVAGDGGADSTPGGGHAPSTGSGDAAGTTAGAAGGPDAPARRRRRRRGGGSHGGTSAGGASGGGPDTTAAPAGEPSTD